ncbi:MAG TPA: sigma-70 family RNA polymerase sigma factor, partial [Polyangiales bacterium]|nr:sigma-70 family RNA polymerase sigma factor [Polyangiales bacterium]
MALPVRVVAVTEEAPALPGPASSSGPAPALAPAAGRDPLRPLPKFETVFSELAPYVMRMLPRLGIAPSDIEDVC